MFFVGIFMMGKDCLDIPWEIPTPPQLSQKLCAHHDSVATPKRHGVNKLSELGKCKKMST